MNNPKQLDYLVNTLLKIKNRKDMTEFLFGILTQQELEEVPMRLQIVKRLKQGTPQHEIVKELNVGVATVTRGSKEIQKGRFQNI